MKKCVNCGALLDDQTVFCTECGIRQPEAQTAAGPAPFDRYDPAEKKAMADMDRFLRYEHAAWKAGGIVFMICAALYVFIGLMYIVIGAANGFSGYGYMSYTMAMTPYYYSGMSGAGAFIIAGVSFIISGLIAFLPAAVINLIMLKKVEYYENVIRTDISEARKRCGSVGMIIFGVLFNNVATIFIIINFVKTKSNKEVLDRIAAKQHGQY